MHNFAILLLATSMLNLLTFSSLSSMFSVAPLSSHLSTPPEALVSVHLKTLRPLNYDDLNRLISEAKLYVDIIVISILELA